MNRKILIAFAAALIVFCAAEASAEDAQFKQPVGCSTQAGNQNVLITSTFRLSANRIVGPGSIHVEVSTDYMEKCPSRFTAGDFYSGSTGFCVTNEDGSPRGFPGGHELVGHDNHNQYLAPDVVGLTLALPDDFADELNVLPDPPAQPPTLVFTAMSLPDGGMWTPMGTAELTTLGTLPT